MGKPLIGTNAELSDALHALAYSLGRADARRRDKAPYGDPTQRAFSRNALGVPGKRYSPLQGHRPTGGFIRSGLP